MDPLSTHRTVSNLRDVAVWCSTCDIPQTFLSPTKVLGYLDEVDMLFEEMQSEHKHWLVQRIRQCLSFRIVYRQLGRPPAPEIFTAIPIPNGLLEMVNSRTASTVVGFSECIRSTTKCG
jgi:hypothetical protein